MKRLKLGSKKLLWQYYISYLAVMLLVMTLMLIFAYNSFYTFHTQIVKASYSNSLHLLRETNENELSRVATMTSQFTSSANISPFVFHEEPEKATRLIKQLSVYRGTSDFFRGLFLMFYGDEYVFSPTSSHLLSNFIHQTAIFEKITPDELLTYLNETTRLTILPEQNVDGYVFNTQGLARQVVPVFVPVAYLSSVRCGTAMFLIEKQTYLEMFRRISLDACDVYILSAGEPLVTQMVTGVPAAEALAAAHAVPGEGETTLRYEGRLYHVLTLPGDTMRFNYMLVIPDEEMAVNMANTMKVVVVMAAFVSALGLLLITLFVQSRIKPIRLLHSMLSDQKASGNELIEIRDSVQRLIDSHAAMSTEMENAETHKKARFARMFLKDGFASDDEWLTLAEDVQINVDRRFFIVCIVAKPSDSDYELTADKVNHLFGEEVSGVARALGVQDKLVLLAFADEEGLLNAWLEEKFAGMRACCAGLTMATSAVHTGRQEGPRAYLEAENAFESRFVRGNATLIRFDAAWETDAGSVSTHQKVIERLRTALREGDAARVRSALDDVAHAMRGMHMSLFTFRCMYNDILSVITGEMQREGVVEQDAYDIFSLSQCLSLDDLDAMLYNACSQLISGRKQDKAKDEAPEDMAEAVEIIRKRFSEPGFSVSAIAEALGMSDSKFSIEFRKAHQMTPTEYLTMHRMRQACRLLHTTDMPVKDIAVECGYYEITGFNRRFKSYTGMTPRQYRQQRDEKGGA